MSPRAAALIELLSLRPHPEGGYYREVFRSTRPVSAEGFSGPRCALTTIYFLIVRGEPSRWHRVVSDEVWHHLEGSVAELYLLDAEGFEVERQILGEPGPQSRPAVVVPGGRWQAARAEGDYVLAGCTVGPGFEFSDFRLLRDEPPLLDRLRREFPQYVDLA